MKAAKCWRARWMVGQWRTKHWPSLLLLLLLPLPPPPIRRAKTALGRRPAKIRIPHGISITPMFARVAGLAWGDIGDTTKGDRPHSDYSTDLNGLDGDLDGQRFGSTDGRWTDFIHFFTTHQYQWKHTGRKKRRDS